MIFLICFITVSQPPTFLDCLLCSRQTKLSIKGDPIYPTPPLGQDMTQGQFFKRSLVGLNSEFSFSWTSCLTKAEEPSLTYYLPIAGGRIIGFIPFPRVLVLCEMQSVLSRNWTCIAVSISCDDNHYTTGTSLSIKGDALSLSYSSQPEAMYSWNYLFLISTLNLPMNSLKSNLITRKG